MTVYTNETDARANATVAYESLHRGVRFIITEVPAVAVPASDNGFAWSRPAHLELTVDGRRVNCPKGTPDVVAKKVRASIDEDAANAELLPQLQAVIHNADQDELVELIDPQVGDVAYVYAMGRTRRGLVTKVTKTRVEIAYTTASNPTRVFRKATAQDGLLTDTSATSVDRSSVEHAARAAAALQDFDGITVEDEPTPAAELEAQAAFQVASAGSIRNGELVEVLTDGDSFDNRTRAQKEAGVTTVSHGGASADRTARLARNEREAQAAHDVEYEAQERELRSLAYDLLGYLDDKNDDGITEVLGALAAYAPTNDVDNPAQRVSFGPDLPTTFEDTVKGLLATAKRGCIALRTYGEDRSVSEPVDYQLRGLTTDPDLTRGGEPHLIVVRTNSEGEPISRAVELVDLGDVHTLHLY